MNTSQLNPYPELIDGDTLTAASAAALGKRVTKRDEKILIEYFLRASRQLGVVPVRLLVVMLYFTLVLIIMIREAGLRWDYDARELFERVKGQRSS